MNRLHYNIDRPFLWSVGARAANRFSALTQRYALGRQRSRIGTAVDPLALTLIARPSLTRPLQLVVNLMPRWSFTFRSDHKMNSDRGLSSPRGDLLIVKERRARIERAGTIVDRMSVLGAQGEVRPAIACVNVNFNLGRRAKIENIVARADNVSGAMIPEAHSNLSSPIPGNIWGSDTTLRLLQASGNSLKAESKFRLTQNRFGMRVRGDYASAAPMMPTKQTFSGAARLNCVSSTPLFNAHQALASDQSVYASLVTRSVGRHQFEMRRPLRTTQNHFGNRERADNTCAAPMMALGRTFAAASGLNFVDSPSSINARLALDAIAGLPPFRAGATKTTMARNEQEVALTSRTQTPVGPGERPSDLMAQAVYRAARRNGSTHSEPQTIQAIEPAVQAVQLEHRNLQARAEGAPPAQVISPEVIERLTEQVVRGIDRRILAQRERMGRF